MLIFNKRVNVQIKSIIVQIYPDLHLFTILLEIKIIFLQIIYYLYISANILWLSSARICIGTDIVSLEYKLAVNVIIELLPHKYNLCKFMHKYWICERALLLLFDKCDKKMKHLEKQKKNFARSLCFHCQTLVIKK